MWDLPRPGLEPVSCALAGRFSTTAPPGKPNAAVFYGKGNPHAEGETSRNSELGKVMAGIPMRTSNTGQVVSVLWA